MEFWKVLKVAETTDEADLRALCANKLRGPYVVCWDKYHKEVAVLLDKDIDVVLSAFDVVDRRLVTSVQQGGSGMVVAVSAWADYLKSGRR
jgi:hypothetical protein